MDPLSGAIVSGVTGGAIGLAGTYMSNQQSSAEAQKNRDFQERMSNTAHQRQVKDLRAAGLNPMLSALGSGASSPGGSQASISDYGGAISTGANTGLAVKEQKSDIELKEQQVDNMRDESFNIVADTKSKWKTIKNQDLQIQEQQMKNHLLKKTMPAMIKQAEASGDWAQVNQLMGVISSGVNSAATAVDTVLPIKSLIKGKK